MIDLTGKEFGRWRVLSLAGRSKYRNRLWVCECACGTVAERTASDLRNSLSCGCLRAEQLAARNRLAAGQELPKRFILRCAHCGKKILARTSRAKYCSAKCKAKWHWAQVIADPSRKAAHSDRVTKDHKDATYVDHPACEHCGKPFRAPPLRKHCSRECLDAVIRSGKYRNAHARRQTLIELAGLTADLESRLEK